MDELRDMRKARGLTLANVAEYIGVSIDTVSRWERGIHFTPAVNVVNLSILYKRSEREVIEAATRAHERYKQRSKKKKTRPPVQGYSNKKSSDTAPTVQSVAVPHKQHISR